MEQLSLCMAYPEGFDDVNYELLYSMGGLTDANGDPIGATDTRYYSPTLQYPQIKYQGETDTGIFKDDYQLGFLEKIASY